MRGRGILATGWARELGRGAIAIGLLLPAADALRAQWDLSSSVAVRETLAQNTSFTSRPGNGDLISTLRLTGRALRTGPRFHLDALYSPDAQFYLDRPQFNRISQMSRATGSYDLSERNVLTFSGTYSYTPNQGVTDESFGSPTVFTHFTNRRQLSALVGIRHRLTERTDLVFDVRHYYQLFSDPTLVDAVGYGGDVRVSHKVSPQMSFDVGVGNSWNRFVNQIETSHTDPNTIVIVFTSENSYTDSRVASLFSGLNRKIGDRLIATGRLGYNVVTPGDTTRPHRHGLLVQASLSWSGPRLSAAGGYSRDISTGSGPLALSQTETAYASTGYKFTQTLTGALLFNRTVSERLESSARESTLAANGTASLRCRLGRRLEGSVGFTRYFQSSSELNAPDLSHNTFSLGLSAAFD